MRVAGVVTGMLAAFALAPGCGVDLASDEDDKAAAETDTDGPAGLGTETGTDDTAGPGDSDGPNGTGLTGAGDSTSGGGTDEGDSACDMLDCSGAGFCELGDEGPVCVCDAGFATIGLDCLPCEPVSAGMLPAEVPAVRADFTFKLDGVEAPASGLEFGRITLRNLASGDRVAVGPTHAPASLLMVPGTYEVLYEFREGSEFPRNHAAVLKQVEIREDNTKLEIDIVPRVVRGSISFPEGSAPASPGLNYGRVWLVDPRTEDRVLLGTTQDAVYDVRVVAGAYEVHYEFRESSGEAPINRDAFIASLEVPDSGDTVRDIVIPVARLTGSVHVDGKTISSGLDYGRLELRDTATGDRFRLGDSNEKSYDVTLVPGNYELVYSAQEFGGQTPVNRNAVVQTIDVAAGDNNVSIDLRTARVDGRFFVDTAAPPTEVFDDGVVSLEGTTGDPIILGNTRTGTYARRVLVGTYQVFYAQETASLTMPVNTHAKIGKPLPIEGDQALDIDIDVVEVVGTMTIDGIPAPDSAYDDGRLFLRDAESGDSVLLGNTREGTYAARLVPGTYDVVYSNEFSDTLLPVNQGAVLTYGVRVTGGAALNIDVPVSTMVGSVGIAGSEPSTAEGSGALYLRDVRTGDEVFIGDTRAAEFTKPLTLGTYLMEYRGTAAAGATLGTSLPANANAAFACVEITAD